MSYNLILEAIALYRKLGAIASTLVDSVNPDLSESDLDVLRCHLDRLRRVEDKAFSRLIRRRRKY